MFCSKCGQETGGGQFCGHCGTPVSTASPICSHCGQPAGNGQFCKNCGKPVGTAAPTPMENVAVPPVGTIHPVTPGIGMATLRIVARKNRPMWMKLLFGALVFPLTFPLFFMDYKVRISIDNQNYTLKSKNLQMDIPVVPGIHIVRISSLSKKQTALIQGVGEMTQYFGIAYGSASTYVFGHVMEAAGAVMSDNGAPIQFEPGEFMELHVKMDNKGQIVEDNKR